jgi:hypothetical protein
MMMWIACVLLLFLAIVYLIRQLRVWRLALADRDSAL